MLGLLGIGGVIAFSGLLLFILLVVAAVFFGRSSAGKPMEAWHTERRAAEIFRTERALQAGAARVPGSLVLGLVFLLSFAVYYFANWLWLSDVWQVR